MSAMTPEKREAAKLKAAATREFNKKIAAAYREWGQKQKRLLPKIEALAADERGDANTRAVAVAMAEKLRVRHPPGFAPPPLPDKLPEMIFARQARRSK